jgi:stringent starvation protein B
MAHDPHGPTDWQDSPALAETRAQAKRQMLQAALEAGKTQLRVDTRRPGVRVPERHEGEPALALNLSWRFPHTDMVLNERGVAATLRFGGAPFRCLLPWSSIWGILAPGSDAVHVWPPDLPEVLGGPIRPREESAPPPVEPVRPQLAVVRSAEATASSPAPSSVDTSAPSPPAAPPQVESAVESVESDAVAPEPLPAAARAPWLRLVR